MWQAAAKRQAKLYKVFAEMAVAARKRQEKVS